MSSCFMSAIEKNTNKGTLTSQEVHIAGVNSGFRNKTRLGVLFLPLSYSEEATEGRKMCDEIGSAGRDGMGWDDGNGMGWNGML